jgi:hypothetical protein
LNNSTIRELGKLVEGTKLTEVDIDRLDRK